MKAIASLFVACACIAIAACSAPPPPVQGPVAIAKHPNDAPPPALSTPVPVVKSKVNPNAGRSDPFAELYGQGGVSTTPRRLGANAYPKIPTLPGFEGAPGGGKTASVWDGVRVSGIVQANGYSAIIEADGKSYVVREGESIANNRIRVTAIGPGYVTLSSAEGVRNFSLGG
jgi:hypothetical protein